MVDVFLELLPSTPRKLKNRAKVRFHTGTSEIISTVILLDRDELNQGETCYAQIRLGQPTAVLYSDHYVLRSYSPVRAIGGGEILNALPQRKKRFSKATLSELKLLHTGDINELTKQFVHMGRFQGLEQRELPFLTNANKKSLDGILKKLLAQKKIIQYDRERGTFIHADFFEKARDEIITTITKYHRDSPLKVGLIKEELRSRTTGAGNPKLFNHIINQLIREEVIVQEKEVLRLKGHKVTLAQDQEKAMQEIEKVYLKSGLKPPYFKELEEKFPGKTGTDVVQVMLKDGLLVKVKEDLFFHRETIEDLKNKLVAFLKEKGEINTPQVKDMTGVSRKYTIPLIEYFDQTRVTVRVGDSRVLRKK